MDTKQATHAQKSVKRTIDLSVYTLFELKFGDEGGPSLPEGVANAICAPMADSPAARRLQLFIASCAEGGLSTKRLLGIFSEWAEIVDARLPDATKRQERMYRTGLRRAIKLAKAIVGYNLDADAMPIKRLLFDIEELADQMGSDWDTDHPAVYTGWTLLLVARRCFESIPLDEAWGHAAAILGSIALVCPNDELEVDLEACADIASRAVFGQHRNPMPAGAPKKSSSVANVNAGTRRSDRVAKQRAGRSERRSA